jgi:hypothetical protein
MSRQLCSLLRAVCCCLLVVLLTSASQAQTGYGVDAQGNLFGFDVTAPGPIPTSPIGNVGFVPEGIDFRPGTNTLFAINVDTPLTQLYTIDIGTAVATAVGAGFNTTDAVAGYDLSGNQRFGFDFNPSTLQGDTSMRIRLISNNSRDNLRINSSTGGVSNVDTDLLIQPGSNSPFADGAAYINNVPNAATIATTLYDMDVRNNSLYTQDPPGAGQMNLVGSFGAGIAVNPGIGFDVYTVPGDADPSLVGDSGYSVLTRDATGGGAYFLYQVNLTTGAIFNGKAFVGGSSTMFTGGFAIAPLPIPEPASGAMLVVGFVVALVGRRRRR